MAWSDSVAKTLESLATPIPVNLPADDFAGYGDSLSHGIGLSFDADPLGSYSDTLAHSKDFSFGADSLGTYADSLGHGQGYSFSDVLAAWDDTVSVSLIGILEVSISDPNEVYTDDIDAETTAPLTASLSDSWGTLADNLEPTWTRSGYVDSVSVFKAGAEPIYADLPADALGSYADSIDAQFYLRASPDASALNAWSDSLGLLKSYLLSDDALNFADEVAITLTDYQLKISPAASALNNWIDSVDSALLHSASLTDDLLNLADAVSVFKGEPQLLVSPEASALNLWLDSVAYNYGLILQSSDSLDSWVDQLQAGVVTNTPLYAELTDAKDDFVDSLGVILAHRVFATDQWHFSVEPISVGLSDSNEAYTDYISTAGGQLQVSLTDVKTPFADALSFIYGIPINVREPSEIAWTAVDGGGGAIEGFRVYRGISSGVYTAYYQIADPNARSVAITTAVPPGEFYIAVAAYNAGGISAYSNELLVSYHAGFLDSIVVRSDTVSLLDIKPPFEDSISVRFTHIVDATDSLDSYADSVSSSPAIRVELSDAKDEFVDYLIHNHILLDSMEFADGLQVSLGYDVSLTESKDDSVDSLTIALGVYIVSEISVDINDNLDTWVDELISEASAASDLKARLNEAFEVYVDEILGNLVFDVGAEDALGSYSDIFGWAWEPELLALFDSIPAKVDSLQVLSSQAAIVDLPGVNFDVVATSWQSLGDDNLWHPVEYPVNDDN